MTFEARNLIAGEFSAAHSQEWLERPNPLTSEPRSRVADSNLMDVVRAIQASNKAWTSWSRTTPSTRADLVQKLAEELRHRAEEFAQIIAAETGATLSRAKGSVERSIEACRFFATVGSERSFQGSDDRWLFSDHRLPIGIAGVISSADEPLFSLASRVTAALAVGNTVIAKPSSFAPQTADLFAKCLQQTGLQPGVFNLVQGRGESVGQAMAQHPALSTLALTGRTETGRTLQLQAAEFLKRVQLSLSACNSVLVFDGVDLDSVCAQVVRLCLTSDVPQSLKGQRVFVQESIYKKFLETLELQARQIKIGDPRDPATRLGPLKRASDVSRFRDAVEQAKNEKGKLLLGGVDSPSGVDPRGNFVQPTVVYDLHLCSTLQQEEIPGPLALVESVKYPHDAIRHSHNSPYGVATHLFHPDNGVAHKIAERIESGRIFVNTPETTWDSRMRFGGLKQSGLGREGLADLLMFFSRQTLIISPQVHTT